MINRIEPTAPVDAYKTYQILAPRASHHRPASCAEIRCANHLNGWRTKVDETTELGKRQAWYVRNEAGRAFTEERHGPITTFTFEAGQRCFTPHTVRLDRPEIFLVRGGDWRGNPSGEVLKHQRAADWVDDFGEHQIKVAEQIERG